MSIQLYLVNPENIYTSIIIQTEQFVYAYLCTYTHKKMTAINNKKEAMGLWEIKKGYMEEFGEREGKGEMM